MNKAGDCPCSSRAPTPLLAPTPPLDLAGLSYSVRAPAGTTLGLHLNAAFSR